MELILITGFIFLVIRNFILESKLDKLIYLKINEERKQLKDKFPNYLENSPCKSPEVKLKELQEEIFPHCAQRSHDKIIDQALSSYCGNEKSHVIEINKELKSFLDHFQNNSQDNIQNLDSYFCNLEKIRKILDNWKLDDWGHHGRCHFRRNTKSCQIYVIELENHSSISVEIAIGEYQEKFSLSTRSVEYAKIFAEIKMAKCLQRFSNLH